MVVNAIQQVDMLPLKKTSLKVKLKNYIAALGECFSALEMSSVCVPSSLKPVHQPFELPLPGLPAQVEKVATAARSRPDAYSS